MYIRETCIRELHSPYWMRKHVHVIYTFTDILQVVSVVLYPVNNLTLYPLRTMVGFPKSPNRDSLPMYNMCNMPSGSH